MSSKIKVVLKASSIPDGSIVSKTTGKKKYTLKHEVRLYYSGEADKEALKKIDRITDDKNIYFKHCVMLVDNEIGNLLVLPDSKELLWHTDYYTLVSFLTQHDDER